MSRNHPLAFLLITALCAIASVQPLGASSGPQTISVSDLAGYWETANINEPFDEQNPKLSLRFLSNGMIITDEQTNRETRGQWKLKGRKIIIKDGSENRSLNRILQFNREKGTMLLIYQMYGTKPLRLRKIDAESGC